MMTRNIKIFIYINSLILVIAILSESWIFGIIAVFNLANSLRHVGYWRWIWKDFTTHTVEECIDFEKQRGTHVNFYDQNKDMFRLMEFIVLEERKEAIWNPPLRGLFQISKVAAADGNTGEEERNPF